jgi:thymidylate kinase
MTPEDEQLIARVPQDRWARNAIPEVEVAAARERAAHAAAEALGDLLRPAGIRTSPLGPGWSRDLDLHVTALPEPTGLLDRGWFPIDRLLGHLGSSGRGRWAVVEDGRLLACADLHTTAPPDALASLLDRCRRRGEVRVREVLELRTLLRSGSLLPHRDPVIEAAADIERGLGGENLRSWASGRTRPVPAPLDRPPARSAVARWRSLLRPRFVVALSGVDGAGKSTVAGALAGDLERLGIPAGSVWTRPGMRLHWLDRLARAAKRPLRQDAAPGVGRVAAGLGSGLASRRGVVGWTWALLVTAAFLRDARRRHRRARGVVIHDRHLLDAIVTLEFVYAGVDLRLHRALVRRFLPAAALTVYLDLPATVAAARKPDDLFGSHAVSEQLERYSAHLHEIPGVHTLDATRPPAEMALQILRMIG